MIKHFKKKKKEIPDNTVRNYVESFFEPIRYSKKSAEVKKAIIETLEPVWAEMKFNDSKNAFRNFVAAYPDLDALIDAAGIERAETNEWSKNKPTISFENFRAVFNRHRRWCWIIVALLVFSSLNLATSVLYFSKYAIPWVILNVALCALGIFFAIRSRKIAPSGNSYSVDDFQKLEVIFDRYARKSLNWLMILFFGLFSTVFELISLGINSKAYEIAEHLSSDMRIVSVVVFFFIKNLLLIRWLLNNTDYEKHRAYKKEFRRTIILSSVFWIIALGLYFVFEYYLAKDISLLFFALYALIIIAFNVFRLKRFCYSTPRFTKPAVALALVAAIIIGGYAFMSKNVWLTQPYINSVPNVYDAKNEIVYDESSGVYTITNDDDSDFKILQLTDIHIGGSLLSYDKDLKALKACFKLIEHTKPDLVVVTGDLSFPMGVMSFSFNNTAPVQQFAAFMRNTGVPWAFTYGNHDTESMAILNEIGLDELYRSLSWDTSKNLIYPYSQPEAWGRNNQLIEIRNHDGTLNQALFLIDSNAYTGDGLNKYDFIHDDQVEWYKEQVLRLNAEEGRTVSSMGFFHIPLQQYKTAYELYESGSNEVKYFFGSNDEKMINKICCSEYPSALFDTAKELGSTTAFFCGHDHYNNMSLEYQGIRLTYGMSIDYLVMPGIARDTKQRGGTLITCHPDSSYDIEQIPLTSIE